MRCKTILPVAKQLAIAYSVKHSVVPLESCLRVLESRLSVTVQNQAGLGFLVSAFLLSIEPSEEVFANAFALLRS
jgi:hypothetical protein